MKISARMGKKQPPKRPDCISYEVENKMWETNALGSDTPSKLVNCILYLVGIHCGLRGRLEQYNLTV